MSRATVTKLPRQAGSVLPQAVIQTIYDRTTEAICIVDTVRNALGRAETDPENFEHSLIHVMTVVERLLDEARDAASATEAVHS